jgi:antitoxin PrlF
MLSLLLEYEVKMALTSTVSSKGQVTIPQEVRTRLGLREGDRVEFVVEGDKTVFRPARGHLNLFDSYIGIFPWLKTRQEINAWISEVRGRNPDEETEDAEKRGLESQ